MDTILDAIITTSIIAILVGLPLGLWVYGMEWFLEKFNLKDKLINLFRDPKDDF